MALKVFCVSRSNSNDGRQRKLIDIVSLELVLATALLQAHEFDLNPAAAQDHFAELQRVLHEGQDSTKS